MNNRARLLEALKSASKSNPLYMPEIMAIGGFKTEAEAREEIADMRQHGEYIVSFQGAKGYWMAQNEADLMNFYAVYTGNAKKRLSNGKKMVAKWFRDQNERMEIKDEI